MSTVWFHFFIFVRKEPALVKFIAGFLLRLGLVFLEGFNINKPISDLGLCPSRLWRQKMRG
jgi:hypothetical protein